MGLFDTVRCDYPLPDRRHQDLQLPAEVPVVPPLPPAQPEPGRGALARAKEVALLENLQLRRTRLSDLFVRCSSHWGFEDPVYRFYHQSFKVFGLQAETEAVVQELSRLLPGQPMNSWFLEMALRYAHLEAPPNPLPSGYATLLYLYGLR